MWLYRLFKRNVANTLITVDSGVTSGITVPALTVTGATVQKGATTQTAAETFTAVPVSSGVKSVAVYTGSKVLTAGGIDIWVGTAPGAAGPTPAHIGDIFIGTTSGKLYVADAISAYTDFKVVTSA